MELHWYPTNGHCGLADKLMPIIEKMAKNQSEEALLNGVSLLVTRLLGKSERAGSDTTEWARRYGGFIYARFGTSPDC